MKKNLTVGLGLAIVLMIVSSITVFSESRRFPNNLDGLRYLQKNHMFFNAHYSPKGVTFNQKEISVGQTKKSTVGRHSLDPTTKDVWTLKVPKDQFIEIQATPSGSLYKENLSMTPSIYYVLDNIVRTKQTQTIEMYETRMRPGYYWNSNYNGHSVEYRSAYLSAGTYYFIIDGEAYMKDEEVDKWREPVTYSLSVKGTDYKQEPDEDVGSDKTAKVISSENGTLSGTLCMKQLIHAGMLIFDPLDEYVFEASSDKPIKITVENTSEGPINNPKFRYDYIKDGDYLKRTNQFKDVNDTEDKRGSALEFHNGKKRIKLLPGESATFEKEMKKGQDYRFFVSAKAPTTYKVTYDRGSEEKVEPTSQMSPKKETATLMLHPGENTEKYTAGDSNHLLHFGKGHASKFKLYIDDKDMTQYQNKDMPHMYYIPGVAQGDSLKVKVDIDGYETYTGTYTVAPKESEGANYVIFVNVETKPIDEKISVKKQVPEKVGPFIYLQASDKSLQDKLSKGDFGAQVNGKEFPRKTLYREEIFLSPEPIGKEIHVTIDADEFGKFSFQFTVGKANSGAFYKIEKHLDTDADVTRVMPESQPEKEKSSVYTLGGYTFTQGKNRKGKIEKTSCGILMHGGKWTNARIKNGVRDGNEIVSNPVSFRNKIVRYIYKPQGQKYMGFHAGIENVSSPKYYTLDHSWAGSKVMKSGENLYGEVILTDNEIKYTLHSGGFSNQSGAKQIVSNTVKLDDKKMKALQHPQRFYIRMDDNYGNENNKLCLSMLEIKPYTSKTVTDVMPEPQPDTEKSSVYTLGGYTFAQGENRKGKIEKTSCGILMHGGKWTNGRLKNGVRDGNEIVSNPVSFRNKIVRYIYKPQGQKYMGFDAGIQNLFYPKYYCTLDHSWAGSKVIKSGENLYGEIILTDNEIRYTLHSGGFSNQSGAKQIISNTVKLDGKKMKALQHPQRFYVRMGDNYGNENNKLCLNMLEIKPYTPKNEQQSHSGGRSKNDFLMNDFTGNPIVDQAREVYNQPEQELPFKDLPKNHWSYEYVNKLYRLGLISGYPDGTFRPDDVFNRDAFASLLKITYNLPEYQGQQIFVDVPTSHWAYSFISAAEKAEVATYYTYKDGKHFKPSEPAEREDVAVALVKLLGLDLKSADLSVLDQYKDADQISRDLRPYLALANQHGIMRGDDRGYLNPKGDLTRAAASKVFTGVIDIMLTQE